MNSTTIDPYEIPPKVDLHKVPSFLFNKDPDGYKRLSEWLYGFYFHQIMAGKEEMLDQIYVKERATAEAMRMALEQTNYLVSMTEGAFAYQVHMAERYKWYSYWEAENVVDMLSQILDHEDQRTKIYDLKNWISLIPTLEKMGVTQDELFGVPLYFEKARNSLPAIKQILGQEGKDRAEEQLHSILKDIADPKISVEKIRDTNFQRMIKLSPRRDVPLANAKVFMIGETDLILIEAVRFQTTAIEYKLKGIVEGFDIRDAASVLSEMNQMVFNSKERRWIQFEKFDTGEYQIVNAEQGKGLQVPSPGYLSKLIMDEVAHSFSLISQMLARGIYPSIPVYEFLSNVRQEDVPALIKRNFRTEANLSEIDRSFQAFYKSSLSEELRQLFPVQELSIMVSWNSSDRMLGIFLNITQKNPEASGFVD